MQSPQIAVPPEFQAEPILKLDEPALIQILKDPESTVFQKNVACRRLALIGTAAAVPALAALLTHAELAHYARFALKPIPDPAVDAALLAAIPKVKGRLLVGVVNTIGQRQDAEAVEPLSKLMMSADPEVAEAAALAIGKIGGPGAAKVLLAGLNRTKSSLRTALADAALICAEGLLAKGDRPAALALYDALSRPGIPRTARLAAMHSAFAAETSFSRPRTPAPPK
jgi:HEAT repeat protein